jgi:hypothetical protein
MRLALEKRFAYIRTCKKAKVRIFNGEVAPEMRGAVGPNAASEDQLA